MKDRINSKWKWGTIEDVRSDKSHSITGGPFGSDLKTTDYTEDGVQIIQLQNIGDGKFINKHKVYTSNRKANQLIACNIYPNEIIIAKMADPVARACIIPSFQTRYLMASDGIRLAVDHKKHDIGFIVSIINHPIFRNQAIAKSTGTTRARIGLSELKSIQFPLPPLPQQRKIAHILSTVDAVIEQTEAAIAKYQQIKQGLMHDLFTRGIGADGQLRPPREEAPHLYRETEIGWVPKEWGLERLATVCQEIIDCPHTTPEYLTEGVLVARTMHIRNGRYDSRNSSCVSEEEYSERISRLKPREGDVIFTREAPIGEAFVIPSGMKICLGQRVMLFRTNQQKCLSQYLLEVFYSQNTKRRFDGIVGGTTNPHLNVADLRNFKILIPSIVEQMRISELATTERESVNFEILQLEKLKALKQGLMQDLLTGQVEVSPDPVDTSSISR